MLLKSSEGFQEDSNNSFSGDISKLCVTLTKFEIWQVFTVKSPLYLIFFIF